MTTQHRLALRILLVLGPATAVTGCGIVGVSCTEELRPSVTVEVRDPVTGTPAARGATGRSEHETGVFTEFFAIDDLSLYGNWASELPGSHAILVRKPGFRAEIAHADVDADRCHVVPETVQVELAPDPRAVPVHPVSFIEGPDTLWHIPSAEVQVYGDTLEIKGFARIFCTRVRVVAFRSGSALHVQIEPSDTRLESCASSRQFEARFTLPPERTDLLVTNGYYYPVELFDGPVRPIAAG